MSFDPNDFRGETAADFYADLARIGERRRDAERDEALEREEILSAVAGVIGPERLDDIVLDVFNGWMRALDVARKGAR